jgi:CheY-like chemotaxis protein/AraC-like DNA-binding protein
MLEIMVVDDESLIRSVLRSIIGTEKGDFRIVAEAYSGIEALKVARQRPLDVILTDLRMPGMTGLELIQALKPTHPDLRFVVLSSYDEFNLVRDAFKLGITEYLLKSEMTAEGIHALLRRIDIEAREDRRLRGVTDYLLGNRRLIRESLLSCVVLHPERVTPATMEEIRALRLRLVEGGRTALLTMAVEDLKREDEESSRSHELRASLYTVLEGIVDNDGAGEVFYHPNGEFLVVWSVDEAQTAESVHSRAAGVFHEARERIHAVCGVDVVGGLSEVGLGLASLPELRRQSVVALGWRFVHGKGDFFPHGVVARGCPSAGAELGEVRTEEKEQELKGILRAFNRAADTRGVDGLCLDRRRVRPEDVPAARKLYERYYHVIHEFAQRFGLDDVLVDRCAEFERHRRAGTLDDFNHWLRQTLADLRDGMAGSLHLLGKAKLLISQRYPEPLSLAVVARELGVGGNYLSRVFAREGVSFSEYLTRVRIDAAIELMRTTTLKVYQIAERLGFSSPESFCRTFKRVTGRSPSRFVRPVA